jgi:hypothetical protein
MEYMPGSQLAGRQAWTIRCPEISSTFRPTIIPPNMEKAPPASRLISAGMPVKALNCLESRSTS